jgi:hypothetical protein
MEKIKHLKIETATHIFPKFTRMQENVFDSCMHFLFCAHRRGRRWCNRWTGPVSVLGWTRLHGWSAWASFNYWKPRAPVIPTLYIYCIYILHENARRLNLRARSKPTAPPRPYSSLPHVFVPPARSRQNLFTCPPPPAFALNGSYANGSTSSHKLQSHQTSSCNYTRQQQSLFCLTDFWT